MPPKPKPRKHPEAIILQPTPNVSTRSIYGDHRTATEDAMMAAHAKALRAAGIIDEEMEKQLSQVRLNGCDSRVLYTAEYLLALPSYTGTNVDEMPSLEVALKRQKERDLKEEKILEDYRAGRIDLNGRPVRKKRPDRPLSKATKSGGQIAEGGEKDHAGDTTISEEQSPNNSPQRRPFTQKSRKTPAPPTPISQDKATLSQYKPATRTPSAPIQQASPPSPPRPITPSPTHSPKRPRIRHPTPSIPPLTPLPSHPTYATYDYYALAALCRERNLLSGGCTPALRNRLVQDDINVAMGKKRDTKTGKGASRRVYVHGVPGELSGRESGGRDGSSDGSASVSASGGEKGGEKGSVVGRCAGVKRGREESERLVVSSEEASEMLERNRGERSRKKVKTMQ